MSRQQKGLQQSLGSAATASWAASIQLMLYSRTYVFALIVLGILHRGPAALLVTNVLGSSTALK